MTQTAANPARGAATAEVTPPAPSRSLEGQAAGGPSATASVHDSNKLQVANRAPELRRFGEQGVAPVNWLGKPQRSDPFATPSRLQVGQAPTDSLPAGSADYFEQPFGDQPAGSGDASPSRNRGRDGYANVAQDGRILPTQANQEFVPPGPEELDPNNQLRGPIEFRPQTSRSAEADSTPGVFLPTSQPAADETLPPPSTDQEPAFEPPTASQIADPVQSAPIQMLPQDADPSLSENDDDGQRDANAPLSFPQQGEEAPPIETLPPPRGSELEAPSMQAEELFPGFPGREPTEADQRDLDRLNQGLEREQNDRLDSPQYGSGTDFLDPKGFTCDDFRKRIAAQTIDKISLDVSPPFRPDEFDVQRYEKLKADFEEKQVIRPWVSIDGRQLAVGRLRDLAYEKAVIETEDGSIVRLPINRLSEGDIAYVTQNWGLPRECLIEQVAYQPRAWSPVTMTWTASNLCHNPLYFEDVNLERYGHTRGPVLEPMVQTAHFFGNVLILPYKMGVHTPHECQYALGYYRPGDCAPWIKPPVPLSARGAIAQAATMTGLFWLIP
jgi:hypothetical protein